MPAPDVLSLLLADSRTPTGGYAHSAGLEPAVAAGLTVAEVPAFLAARLETVAAVEASFAAAACAASTPELRRSAAPRGLQIDAAPALLALDEELAARTASAPQRVGLRQLGRALLRVGERLWPGDPLVETYVRESAWTPRPVALGLLAARAGLTPCEAARLSLYEDAAGVAAAALKLLPLDSAETTAWVAASAQRIADLAEAAVPDHGAADRLPATSTPLLDLRSLDHERLPGRHFVT